MSSKDVDKPVILEATREDASPMATKGLPKGAYDPRKDEAYLYVVKGVVPQQVSPEATKGLPEGAYDPKKDEAYKEVVRSNVIKTAKRKEGVYGVGDGED